MQWLSTQQSGSHQERDLSWLLIASTNNAETLLRFLALHQTTSWLSPWFLLSIAPESKTKLSMSCQGQCYSFFLIRPCFCIHFSYAFLRLGNQIFVMEKDISHLNLMLPYCKIQDQVLFQTPDLINQSPPNGLSFFTSGSFPWRPLLLENGQCLVRYASVLLSCLILRWSCLIFGREVLSLRLPFLYLIF